LPQLLEFTPLDMWAVWIYPKLIDSWLGRRHQALRVRPEVDRLLATEIREHRDDPAGRDDVLALLVAARDEQGEALTDEELRDHVITLLLAGHETTATALAWCFERLLRHPTALARLRDELESGADEPYLDAVISETLRVRPVIDAVWRKLTAPAVVGDHVLPAGTVVMPAIAIVQRSDAYDDADAFRPERFLGTSAPAYTFIPFGGGPRRCIGASFALMEMKAVLRAVLARVELSPAGDPEPARVHHITLVPARGGQVIATARRSAAGTGPTRPAVRDGGEPIPSAP
jgi:cytochrome P450